MGSDDFEKHDEAGLREKPFVQRTYDDESPPAVYSNAYADADLKPVYDSTHRKLKARHIQLIGIGG